jgi:hypothetical protein
MADETGKEEHEDEPAEDEDSSTEASDVGDEDEASTDSETATDEDEKPDVTAASADEDDDSEYGGARSEVDAMGNDKRREVVGQQYGATVRKRLLVYGGVVGVIVVVVIAFLTVVKGYDNRDVPLKDTAPWTEAGASQAPPRDVDFKANGPTDTIPAKDIVNR